MSSSSFIPQIQNDPILQLPHQYIAGLNISVASTTVLAIAPGQARDNSDNIDMPVSFPNLSGNVLPSILYQGYMQPLFINSAVNGANGLDQGSLIATMDYAVYLIGDSRQIKPVAGLISLTSNAAPLLPLGYDSFALLGFVETSGSTTFVASGTNPINARNLRCYYLSPASSVLSGGSATTFTDVDLNTPVPTGTARDVIVYLLATFIPAAIGDTAQFRPDNEGTPQTAGLVTITGIAAGVAQTQYITVIAGVNGASHAGIDYKVSSSSDSLSLSVVGYCYIPTSYVP
jgi:hypothetical protein